MIPSWRSFGRYEVLLLLDGKFEADGDVFIHAQGDAACLRAMEDQSPRLTIDVNCFALRSAEGTMLVDTGVGSSWGPAFGHARAAMAAAGLMPETIGHILLTHIHGDHALGLVEAGAAYFPHAEILVPEADLAFFTDPDAEAATPRARRGGFDVARAFLPAYQGRIRPVRGGPVLPEIEAVALPGHTPGHGGYLIGPASNPLLLWGDALHLAEAQVLDPDIGLIYDLDPVQAAKTRRMIVRQACASRWTVGGGHMRGFGHIRPEGDGFRLRSL